MHKNTKPGVRVKGGAPPGGPWDRFPVVGQPVPGALDSPGATGYVHGSRPAHNQSGAVETADRRNMMLHTLPLLLVLITLGLVLLGLGHGDRGVYGQRH